MERINHESISRSNISNELAGSNPELFKSVLLELLKTETKFSSQIWDTLCQRDEINSNKVAIDSKNWTSNSNMKTGSIHFGAKQMSENFNEELIFEDWKFKEEKQLVYRLSHEISHFVIPKLLGLFNYKNDNPHIASKNFFEILYDVRSKGKGFTPLGSLEFYKKDGEIEQANEDHAELINMYLIDPEYLKRYLTFLSNDKYEGVRNEKDLVTITPDIAENVFKLIEDSIKFFRSE
ncbi:MAG: hypothetical protein KAI57_03200 [Candidatus Pacebacteria bacterium]|nr:hypothetical protein [Candidatus Paceibacterota bacterium]